MNAFSAACPTKDENGKVLKADMAKSTVAA